jgi:hypothetical protein
MYSMRLIIALVLICFVSTSSFAADPAKPNYYPLAKGTKWEYRLTLDERDCDITCEIMETQIRYGMTHARMEAQLPNSVSLAEVLSTDAKGVYRNAIVGAKLVQPIHIIKYPVKARDVWKDKIRLGENDGNLNITVKDIAAAIEVPAGKFTTLSIESIVEMSGEKVVACIWYADGVGIVKQETTSGSKVMLMELKKFTAGK